MRGVPEGELGQLICLQRRLEHFYALEEAPDVTEFVRPGEPRSRETLLISERDDELHLALVLPARPTGDGTPRLDEYLQWVEGVSHFLHVVERARTGLPTTHLELELQAEVDKFVTLALDRGLDDRGSTARLVRQLFEQVRFLHPASTPLGQRYRVANQLAARFLFRLLRGRTLEHAKVHLRRFYRAGQAEKIRLAQAA